MTDALTRIRILRRDSYLCHARTARGAMCGAPASQVGAVGGESVAVCLDHWKE